jgi:CRISPR-associated endonuclease/helicase Cas3
MRLALSCLVDADHADTAFFDTGRRPPDPPEPKWADRLKALCRYVRQLPSGETIAERERNRRRAQFFETCLDSSIEGPMTACDGPVGLGKTTAVVAYLMRRAMCAKPNLRRLIIVAPYTNILSQTADRLRKAVVLPDERPERVIVEHHHRADFADRTNRDLAVLWQAPIVLTTAVSFFETLAGCNPGSLRKLHALPGSAVFVDEAHAALPTRLWPQNWRWLRELVAKWGCRFVFASGSLARFWEEPDIIDEPVQLPDLLPRRQAVDVFTAERERVNYRQLANGRVITVAQLIDFVRAAPGPRLVILNTVQNAAVVASAMRKARIKTLHLSTALCPGDRECILAGVERRLQAGWKNWVLVATSCVEAGLDFSFCTGFRERFAVASTIQVGGRVNRHGKYDRLGGGVVYDFALADRNITQHPDATVSADLLHESMEADELNRGSPADVVTKAMQEELRRLPLIDHQKLLDAEAQRNYPAVAELGRVISAETRLVVVDPRLKKRFVRRLTVNFKELLRGSVQLWATKIETLGLEMLPGRRELYAWNDAYDPDFLGYMAGILRNKEFLAEGGTVI